MTGNLRIYYGLVIKQNIRELKITQKPHMTIISMAMKYPTEFMAK